MESNVLLNQLGDTSLQVSSIGFGTYRCLKSTEYKELLKEAIHKGINLIDTSTNYLEGYAEEVVGEVLNTMIYDDEINREDVVVVSKCGYLQGQTYSKYSQKFPQTYLLGPNLAHCIHPEFIEQQLSESLLRLNLNHIDVYLLHNPEYFFEAEAHKNLSHQEQQVQYYKTIKTAFIYLEEQVEKGKISYYGISSNTFQLSQHKFNSTSLLNVLDIAQSINAKYFKVIQCPFNILEHDLACIEVNQKNLFEVATNNGIGVLANRPFNAFQKQHLCRLIDVECFEGVSQLEIEDMLDTGIDYEQTLKVEMDSPELKQCCDYLNFFSNLRDLFHQDLVLHSFQYILEHKLLVVVEQYMDLISQQALSEKITEYIESYFSHFNHVIKLMLEYYSNSHFSKLDVIKHGLHTVNNNYFVELTMQRLALRSYRHTKGITSTLMGIRSASHLEDAVSELSLYDDKYIFDWKLLDKKLINQL